VASESTDVVVALDIGGTKLAAGLVSVDGEVLCRDEQPTGGADADALFVRVAGLLDGALSAAVDGGHRAVACGVGCGGPMTSGGEEVSPLNIHQWRGFPLRRRVAERTGLPTAVDNDAKALALAEGWRGAARGARSYLGMVVSTGVGGGLVVDGRLLEGDSGNAGHIGHVVVEPEGRECVCGGRGCLEALISGPSIKAITGHPPESASLETIEHAGLLLGRALTSVMALLDVRLATVAGSVALGFGEPFFAAAQAELDRRARIEYLHHPTVVPGGLGADGPLVGAAAVGLRVLHLGGRPAE
jgi:glucokinase